MKQRLIELKGKIERSTTVADFSVFLLDTDRNARKKLVKT